MFYLSNTKMAHLLRQIRISRNYSQDYVCKGICSQSMLSRFENGDVMLTFQKALLILKRLDITMNEFETLLLTDSIKYRANLLFNNYVKKLDITSLRNNDTIRNHCPLFPYFASWIKYCLNIKIKHTQQINFSYMQKLLNQDTFYINDFELLIYGLPTLPAKSIKYNFKRIYQNMLDRNIYNYKPWLFIDLLITMGCIYYYDRNVDNARFYWKEALFQAKAIWDIQRMKYIIILLNCSPNSNIQGSCR